VTLTAVTAHSHTGGWLLLAIVGLSLVAGYVIACWIWPFRACPRCDGSGKIRSPSGKAWRPCKRCKGGGARLRIGRRIFNYGSRLHREGTR
jgi:hypothetical protein